MAAAGKGLRAVCRPCLRLRLPSLLRRACVRRQSWDWEQHIANVHLLRWFMDDVEVGCGGTCLGAWLVPARLLLPGRDASAWIVSQAATAH
jgi:hypothetical protein